MGNSPSDAVASQSTPYFTNVTAEIKAHLSLNVWNMRASLVTDKLLSLYIFQMVPATDPFVSLSARRLIHFSFYFLVSAAQLELWNSKGHHDRFWWLDIKPWLKKERKKERYRHPYLMYLKFCWKKWLFFKLFQPLFEPFPYSLMLISLNNFLSLWNLQHKLAPVAARNPL